MTRKEALEILKIIPHTNMQPDKTLREKAINVLLKKNTKA